MAIRRIKSVIAARWPVVALFVVGIAGLTLTRLVTAAPGMSGDVPAAETFEGVRSVGALFASGRATHHCTASIVGGLVAEGGPSGIGPSRAGSTSGGPAVVLTAAHCLSGAGPGLQFAPGYREGDTPLGRWTVVAAYADPRWVSNQDPQYDYAFLTVDPQQRDGSRTELGDLVRGYRLGQAVRSESRIEVVGYVSGSNDRPIHCGTGAYLHQGFPAFDCHGFAGGTSGSPWLVAGTGEGATVTGVIGGWHQGGCTESTSYSARFDQDTLAVYRRAVEAGPGDVLPNPVGDGC